MDSLNLDGFILQFKFVSHIFKYDYDRLGKKEYIEINKNKNGPKYLERFIFYSVLEYYYKVQEELSEKSEFKYKRCIFISKKNILKYFIE